MHATINDLQLLLFIFYLFQGFDVKIFLFFILPQYPKLGGQAFSKIVRRVLDLHSTQQIYKAYRPAFEDGLFEMVHAGRP